MRFMISTAALAVCLTSSTAFAQDAPPANVRNLIGAKAAGGETQLKARGYTLAKSEKGADRIWSNWWNARTQTCLSVVTMNGRYNSIVTAPAFDCNQSAGGSSSVTGVNTPSGVADLVGARAAGGETQLNARGYSFIKSQKGSDRIWSNWWNPRSQTCLSVVTMEGRYNSIVSAPSLDCQQSASAPAPDSMTPVISFSSGHGVATFSNGCAVTYNYNGTRWGNTRQCNKGMLIRADEGMAAYRREQGMAGPVADHNMGRNEFDNAGVPHIAFAHGEGRVKFDNGCVVHYDVEVRPTHNNSTCTRDQLYKADDAVWEARQKLNTNIPLPTYRYQRSN